MESVDNIVSAKNTSKRTFKLNKIFVINLGKVKRMKIVVIWLKNVSFTLPSDCQALGFQQQFLKILFFWKRNENMFRFFSLYFSFTSASIPFILYWSWREKCFLVFFNRGGFNWSYHNCLNRYQWTISFLFQ